MDIFVYSDESGVFDKNHNPFFAFGGVVFLSKESKDVCARKYLYAERTIRSICNASNGSEVKSSALKGPHKQKLYRSLNQEIKFGTAINLNMVNDAIFQHKKNKQRYMDYAYKIAIKRCFSYLIFDGRINPQEVNNIFFCVDEHSTATNGRYELRECLEQELKIGTFNQTYHIFYKPLFASMKGVSVSFCNSASTTLVRAADVVANKILYETRRDCSFSSSTNNLFVCKLP